MLFINLVKDFTNNLFTMSIKITGIGSFIPGHKRKNSDFLKQEFRNNDGSRFPHANEITIEKFKAITGIEERRYLEENLSTSDMATVAAQKALEDAGIDPETLDYLIVAHNYGDVKFGTIQSDTVPSLARSEEHTSELQSRENL